MTLNELYRAAKTALEPVTEDPTFEAACLLEHFCGANRTELLLHGDKPAESEAEQAVLSAKRASRCNICLVSGTL